jgi:N-acetylmuramidase/Putative peptidoglycan binding domain
MPDFVGGASPLSTMGATNFAKTTNTGLPEMWSVLSVETSGCGFLPDKRPKILFERHKFHALTGGAFDRSHPDISQPSAGGYGPGGANQYNRLAEAIALDRPNALKSASWGIGQIMGLNHKQAGFEDVEAMVSAMQDSEDAQLSAMASFLDTNHLAGPLARHEWTNFALGYNGPNFAQNNYDGLLQQFFGHFTNGPLPDLTIRTVQVLLTYRGIDPRGIDGVLGKGTQSAIRQFQALNGMTQTGKIDNALLKALSA